MVYEQVATYGGNNKYNVASSAGKFDKTNFLQNNEATRKVEKDKYENEKSKYGVWGSTFKDQRHFVDMHHC